MTYCYFSELPVKAHFICNGNKCIKKSSKTAELIEYSRWFYFSQHELCIVSDYCRLDKNYFNN